MSVENTTTIKGLNTSNPNIIDPVHEGPDHIWLIKRVLKHIFPGAGGGFERPIIATEDELNTLSGVFGTPAEDNGKISTLQQFVLDMRYAVKETIRRVTALEELTQKLYPVGSIFITFATESPAVLLGFGVWRPFGTGRTLVGVDPAEEMFNVAGKTGGWPNTTLPAHAHGATTGLTNSEGVVESDGGHTHTYRRANVQGTVQGGGFASVITGDREAATTGSGNHTHNVLISSAGEDPAKKNYPPYITAYMWWRES
jgi:hypothetical protein